MTLSARIFRPIRRFAADDQGATLVEFAIVLVLLLVFLFGLIDFGRLSYNFVIADKSMQVAARIAAVRPPACPGVALTNTRGSLSVTPQYSFGTSCRAAANLCQDPGTVSCTGAASNTTATEVWNAISAGLPNDANIANLRFRYDFNPDLGFLGGPYTPVVTVELENLNFDFIHPLSGLLSISGATGTSGLGGSIPFPSMSVSLPGEDLAHGSSG